LDDKIAHIQRQTAAKKNKKGEEGLSVSEEEKKQIYDEIKKKLKDDPDFKGKTDDNYIVQVVGALFATGAGMTYIVHRMISDLGRTVVQAVSDLGVRLMQHLAANPMDGVAAAATYFVHNTTNQYSESYARTDPMTNEQFVASLKEEMRNPPGSKNGITGAWNRATRSGVEEYKERFINHLERPGSAAGGPPTTDKSTAEYKAWRQNAEEEFYKHWNSEPDVDLDAVPDRVQYLDTDEFDVWDVEEVKSYAEDLAEKRREGVDITAEERTELAKLRSYYKKRGMEFPLEEKKAPLPEPSAHAETPLPEGNGLGDGPPVGVDNGEGLGLEPPVEAPEVKFGLAKTATTQEIRAAGSQAGWWEKHASKVEQIPIKLVEWMAARGGVLGKVGNFFIQHGSKVGKFFKIAGAAAQLGGSIWEGYTLHELHQARNEIADYVNAHPENKEMVDYLKMKNAEVERHDAYFGVNTGITIGAVGSTAAGFAVEAGVGGAGMAFAAGPLGWALLGIGLIAIGTEAMIEDEAKQNEYRSFLKKWYGSADHPNLHVALANHDPALEKWVKEVQSYDGYYSAPEPIRKYWQDLQERVGKLTMNTGTQGPGDFRIQDLNELMLDNDLEAIKSMEKDYLSEAADHGGYHMSLDYMRREVQRKSAWASIGVNDDPMAYVNVAERNKKFSEHQRGMYDAVKAERGRRAAQEQFELEKYHHDMLQKQLIEDEINKAKKHAGEDDVPRDREYVGDMWRGRVVATEHPAITSDLFDVDEDVGMGAAARNNQGAGVHEIQKNDKTPHHTRMNDLYDPRTHDRHTGMVWTDFSNNNKNNEKLSAHSDDFANNAWGPSNAEPKGIPQTKNPQADQELQERSRQAEQNKPMTTMTTPLDPGHPLGGFHMEVGHNAVGHPAETYPHMVEPGESHNPFRGPATPSTIDLGTLRSLSSWQHSMPNQEPLVVTAHQNYMHSLAKKHSLD
jgi:hypothetical protein